MMNIQERVFRGASNPTREGKVVNAVYETYDYSIFYLSKFNREVLMTNEMLKQAKEGIVAPIIVNEEMIIIDGQNRFIHSRKVNVPVKYIIVEGLTEEDITRMNTNQRKWNLKDFIEAFANQGKEEYIKLIDLINQRSSSGITNVLNVSIDSPTGVTKSSKLIKSGDFQFHNYEKAVEFFRFMVHFREKTKTPKRSKFEAALHELYRLEKFDENRIIRKVIQNELDEEIKVKNTTNHTEALKTLLDAYNHKLSPSSEKYIKYYITSDGRIVINEYRKEWTRNAIEKAAQETAE
ncbi:hypothetical protein ACDX78_13645 [Virgibacillus oceani]